MITCIFKDHDQIFSLERTDDGEKQMGSCKRLGSDVSKREGEKKRLCVCKSVCFFTEGNSGLARWGREREPIKDSRDAGRSRKLSIPQVATESVCASMVPRR